MACQLELKGLVKDYKNFRAVNNVSIEIQKGEIVSLLGPSGCGKTTTLRMIAGLLTPTDGKVFLAGEDITDRPPYKRDVAMVFQNYALFPHMTVYENVIYGLKNRGIKDKEKLKKKAEEVLSIVQLSGVEKRYPRQLSGGQQQRVSLARAMAVEPQIMLFDEPLSNLDAKLRVQTRIEIRNLLKELNITAIYVTHDQEEALTISDYIAVMNKGEIEQLATPTELYNAPKTKFVADFIGHANLLEGSVEKVSEGKTFIRAGENLLIECDGDTKACQGERKTILIRPENIKVKHKNQQGMNLLDAEIEEKNFLGSSVRYKAKIQNGMTVECETHPDNAFAEIGDAVKLYLDKDKIVLMGGT